MTADSDIPLSIEALTPEDAITLDVMEHSENVGHVQVMLDDYVRAKAVHDTGDVTFAHIILNDTYTAENVAAGPGELSAWLNRTVIQVSDAAAIIGGYERTVEGILDMPVHHVLSMPSILVVNVTAGDASRNVTIPMDYEGGHTERIFAGEYVIEGRRDGIGQTSPVVLFRTDEGFGPVRSASVNGVDVPVRGTHCSEWCSVTVGYGEANVMITNVYGGTAGFFVPAVDTGSGESGELISPEVAYMFIFIITVTVIGFVAIKAIHRIMPESHSP